MEFCGWTMFNGLFAWKQGRAVGEDQVFGSSYVKEVTGLMVKDEGKGKVSLVWVMKRRCR